MRLLQAGDQEDGTRVCREYEGADTVFLLVYQRGCGPYCFLMGDRRKLKGLFINWFATCIAEHTTWGKEYALRCVKILETQLSVSERGEEIISVSRAFFSGDPERPTLLDGTLSNFQVIDDV